MRRAVPLLILALVFALPASAQAFTWTRVWAPEFDLTSYGAIGVGDIRVHGSGGLNRDSLEAEVAAAAETLVDGGYLLADDVPELTRRAGAFYRRLMAREGGPSCAWLIEG